MRHGGGDHVLRLAATLQLFPVLRIEHGAVCVPNKLADVDAIADHAALSATASCESLMVPVFAAGRRRDAVAARRNRESRDASRGGVHRQPESAHAGAGR